MKIIDLTHRTSPNMPVYPGTGAPVMTVSSEIEATGFLERKLTLYSHTGTHIDAPSHILKGAMTLDRLPIDHFFGQAVCVDLRHIVGKIINRRDLMPFKDHIAAVAFVLLHTGWSRFWGTEKYFVDYPVLSAAAAKWLCGFDLKGIGVDMISVDDVDADDYPVHRQFLKQQTLLIENLMNLDRLPPGEFAFSCFPLKLEDSDGSPVRAVAMTGANV